MDHGLAPTVLREGRVPARAETRRGLALVALLASALLINLDTTIVNVALPSLVRELNASTTDLQWVVDAYSLVFTAFVLAAGSLSDRLGRKGMLLGGLALFAAASAAGSQGTNASQLIAARAVMGLGAALIFPATLSILTNIFTERKQRARAIGLWGATAGVGIAAGPLVGGWLLEHYSWGSIFLALVPVAIMIAGLVAVAVPTSRDPSTPRLDTQGLVLSALGMGTLILTVIEAPDWGWGSTRTVLGVALGSVLLAAFVQLERSIPNPMLDVRLLRNLRFTAASGSVAIAFFALSGFIFLFTQYFQFVQGYSPLETGVRLLPVASSVGISSVVGTRLAVRWGNKLIVASGLALFGTGLLWASTASQTTGYLTIALQMVVLGSGMGFTTAPATEAIMGAVPKEKAGVGSAVNNATRLFGATLGVAVIGSVAASLYTARLASLLPRGISDQSVSAANGSVGGALGAAQALANHGFTQASRSLSDSAVSAFMHSLAGGCLVAGVVALAGALLTMTLLPARPADTGTRLSVIGGITGQTIPSDVGIALIEDRQPISARPNCSDLRRWSVPSLDEPVPVRRDHYQALEAREDGDVSPPDCQQLPPPSDQPI